MLRVKQAVVGFVTVVVAASHTWADEPRKLAELELRLLGLAARVEPEAPVVPKNTATAVRIVVTAGGQELSLSDVTRFLGAGFEAEAELSGPGLSQTVTIPQREEGEPLPADPLLLALPPLAVAGDYELANLRLVSSGQPVMDVSPGRITLKVIDQILITSVKTRPLTLDEIRQKGIVLDRDDYLSFEFTLGVLMESKPVNISFPVVFDQKGVPVPLPLQPPPAPPQGSVQAVVAPPPLPAIVPFLLEAPPGDAAKLPRDGSGNPTVRIPSVLVIPGNVGYLKQFFSAQLFVANGAPLASGLSVREITATIQLPPGADLEHGTADDPLALPVVVRDGVEQTQPTTLPVRGVGPDGNPGSADDVSSLNPTEQAQAEFLVRGEKEGYHTLTFDIQATLDGLVTGPIPVAGKATGGVLVRNAFFDMTFTVPSVARAGEKFKLFVTVHNISQALANDVRVSIDNAALAGATLECSPDRPQDAPPCGTEAIATLRPGDARMLTFEFRSKRTGQVVATYLRLDDAPDGTTGHLKFTLGVGERGIPLSPDTLVLPTAVDVLPTPVVEAAMRVLGQAWSIANAPAGTLPRGVARTTRTVVTEKALALAEAGLRVQLGEPMPEALRGLLFDFYGGATLDTGFDQLLRQTEAGADFARALAAALAPSVADPLESHRELSSWAASGPDFVAVAVRGANGAPVDVSIADASGKRTLAGPGAEAPIPTAEIRGSVGVTLPGTGSTLSLLTAPTGSPYVVKVGAAAEVALAYPRGDGTTLRAVITTAGRAEVTLDLSRPDVIAWRQDADGDGNLDPQPDVTPDTLPGEGPELVSATVIGPETLDGAPPFGMQAVLLFDRVVDPVTSGTPGNYQVPANSVGAVKRQLSGRLVFAALTQPEGPYIETTLSAQGITDTRGNLGPAVTVPLTSRLEDWGAVVSGRVLNTDGTPVTGARVVYQNNLNTTCLPDFGPVPQYFPGLAAVDVDDLGRYEFRYVRQDNCGYAFKIATTDPSTGGLRELVAPVRAPGEQIVLDVVMFGLGSVTGIVRDLSGAPVPGAKVVVLSVTDTQIGKATETDGDGRYTVSGITVGQVSVKAAKDLAIGSSSGRIDRAGTTGIVDVTLNSGSVDVSGTVFKIDGGVTSPGKGAVVVYYQVGGGGLGGIPVGVATADPDGKYAIEDVPAGQFRITAALNTRDQASVVGVSAAGDVLERDLVIQIPPPEAYGRVTGVVTLPGGAPAGGVVVVADRSGMLTDENGVFDFPVLVRPFVSQRLEASTRDGLRRGSASFILNTPGQVATVPVQLSGLGAVEFTVLDPAGQPLAGQSVGLVGFCSSPCGCGAKKTDAQGRVRFEGLPLGSVSAKAVRQQTGGTDVAEGTASIAQDGATGFGILRFGGLGVVSGEVLPPPPPPVIVATGSTVTLSSLHYDSRFCALRGGVSHSVRLDPTTTRFRFTGVNVGQVSVTAVHPFLPTVVGKSGALTRDGEELTLTLQLVDTTAGVVQGDVFLPDGVTPAGAGVSVTADGPLPNVEVVTDGAGHYRFARIFPEGFYTIIARDPVTGGVVRERIYLRRGQDVVHDLRLHGRGTVRVRVVDGADQPVSNAFVRLTETQFPGRTHEGAVEPANEGVVTFEGVFEGTFSVQAFDAFARGGRASSVLPKPGDEIEVKLRLTTTGSVFGHFLKADGSTPIPYGVVRLTAGGRVIGQVTTQGSGDDVGSFDFDYVPAGAVRVDATDPLTARTGFGVGTIETEGQVLTLDVRAQGIGTVTGLVTSNDDAQPGAHVDINAGSFHACTIADGEGTYLVAGVPEGPVTVTASLANGFLAGTRTGTLIGDGTTLTLDVSLRDAGTVTGQVKSPADGPGPLSVVSLYVGGPGGGAQSTTTDAEGYFTFERVPAAQANLSVDVLGSIDQAKTTVTVPAGGSVDVPITLNGVGRILGHARDSQGGPTAGTVRITGSGVFPYSFTLNVGGDGFFELPEVLAGPFTVSLSARSGDVTLYGTTSQTLAPGETAEVDVQVQPSGTVKGTVLRSDGVTPAYGSDVVLQLDPLRGVVRHQAQPDGGFQATGLPLGAFTVTVTDPLTGGRAVVRGRSLTTNGETVDLGTIVLDNSAPTIVFVQPSDGSARGGLGGPLVLDLADTGSGVDTSTLVVRYPTGFAQAASSFVFDGARATGSLVTSGLVVGANRLRAEVKDLAGNPGEVEITFTANGGSVRVHVRAAGDAGDAEGVAVAIDGVPAGVTGSDGVLVKPGVRPGSHTVVATDPATGLTVQGSGVLADGEGQEILVELTLPAFGRIQGVVYHAGTGGATAAGVVVSRPGRTATTGADGRFDLGAFALGSYTLDATAPDGDRGRTTVTVASLGQVVEAQITLNGLGALTVVVQDSQGAARIPGAAVTVTSSSPFGGVYSGTTDSNGEVTFPKVFAGSVTAKATAPSGLKGETTDLLPPGESRTLTVTLQAGGRVTGTVRHADPEGSVAPGVTVVLTGPKTASTTTDASGVFVFENVPLGSFQVQATEPVTGDKGKANGVLASDGGTATADITLNGVGSVTVLVTDSFGAAVAGATVDVTSGSLFGGFARGTTDSGGSVTFPYVLAGPITASATSPIGTRGTATGPLAPGGSLTLPVTLQDVATLKGRVLSPNGQETVEGATVKILGRTATTPADGSFEFADLPLGTFNVDVTVGGRLRARVSVTLASNGQVLERDIVLIGVGTVSGLVTDPSNNPAAGAQILVYSQTGLFGGSFTGTTGSDGRYAITGVPVGTFTISASRTSLGQRADGSGAVTVDGETVTVDLKLLSNAVTLPRNLLDGNLFLWQVAANGGLNFSGRLVSGSPQLTLTRDGTPATFAGSGNLAASEEAVREIVVRQAGLAGLDVTRKVFIPLDGYFLRYLDVITNPGSEPVTVDVGVQVEAQSGIAAAVVSTSSGDAALSAEDRWAVLDDGAEVPDVFASNQAFGPLAVVLSGADAATQTEPTFDAAARRLTTRWNAVTVPPGGAVAFLYALSLEPDRTRAVAAATRLAGLPPELFAGMTPEEAAAVRNFSVPADLASELEPLPRNDGTVTIRALSGDGVTPVGTANASIFGPFRSRSPYLSRPYTFNIGTDGTYQLLADPREGVQRFIPREGFDVTLAYGLFGQYTPGQPGAVVTSATGAFTADGVIDLATTPGRVARASTQLLGNLAPEKALDGDLNTAWSSAQGDAASPPYNKTPYFEVAFPADVTVHQVRVRGPRGTNDFYNIRRGRLEIKDAAGALLWSADVDFSPPLRDADVDVLPPVPGARSVRLTSLVDVSNQVRIAEFLVMGEASLGPTGRVVHDAVFADTGVVKGRVKRADDSAAPSSKVRLMAGSLATSASYGADASGDFKFVAVPAGTYTLKADHPLGSLSAAVEIVVPANDTVTQDIVYPALGGIQGAVRTAAGFATSGSLSLTAPGFSRSVSAPSSSGQYSFPDVPPGTYTLKATDPRSSAVVTRTVDVVAGPAQTQDFTFPPMGTVKVTATVNGSPLANAGVYVTSESRETTLNFNGNTDASGLRTVPNVPGPNVTVRVQYPGFAASYGEGSGTITMEGETITVPVAVPGIGTVRGFTRSRDGVVHGDVSVLVLHPSGTPLFGSTSSNGSGSFQVANVPVGPFVIRATTIEGLYAYGEVTARLDTHGQILDRDALVARGTLAVAGERQFWELPVAAGVPYEIQLTGVTNGTAPALADPYLEVLAADGSIVASNDNVSPSNKNSRVTFTPSASAAYVVVVRAAGTQSGGYRLGSPYSNHFFRLYGGGTVSGQVTRDADGAPVPGLAVRLSRPAAPTRTTATDADGRYVFPAPLAGDFTVEAVDAEGVVMAQAVGQIAAAGESATADLVVPTHEAVTVTVRRNGQLAADIAVTLASDHSTALDADKTRVRVTNASGVAITSLPVGVVTATATDPEDGQPKQASGTLTAGAPLDLQILLGSGLTTVRGGVFASDGSTPLPGAVVELSGVGTRTADAAGEYRFDAVPPGSYTLSATFVGRSTSRLVTVAGAPEQIENLLIAVPLLKGVVQESTTAPSPGAVVSACGPAGPSDYYSLCAQAVAGDNGAYRIDQLPAWYTSDNCRFVSINYCPNIQVAARPSDGATLSTSNFFRYQPSFTGVTIVNLTFPPVGGVSGYVRDGDRTVAGANVHLQGSYSGTIQSLTADENGFYSAAHVLPQEVRVYAEDPVDAIPGEARGTVVAGQTLPLDVTLVPTATLEVRLADEGEAGLEGQVAVQSLEAPRFYDYSGFPWTRVVSLPSSGSTFRVPGGLFRVVFDGDEQGGPSAAEGGLEVGGSTTAVLERGTHVRLPRLLEGPQGVYYGEGSAWWDCPVADCASFVRTGFSYLFGSIEPFPSVAKPELGGRAFRSLLVAGQGIRARRLQFSPVSGAFARTLTLVENPGPDEVTVPLESFLEFRGYSYEILGTSSGDLSFRTEDSWVAIRAEGGPDIVVVIGPALTPTDVYVGGGEAPPSLYTTHAVTVPPGETRGLLIYTFTRPQGDVAALLEEAQAFAELSVPDALLGLSEAERAAIVNFEVPDPTTGVTGTVLDPTASFGVEDVVVSVVDAQGRIRGEATSDASGAFTVAGLTPGDYGVVAVEPGTNRPGRAAATVTQGTFTPVTVRLLGDAELGTVRVTAVDDLSGDPAAGARVELAAEEYRPVWTVTAFADDQGIATLTGVPAGPVTVTAGTPPAVGTASATAVAGVVTDVTVRINAYVSLPADLTGADGFAQFLQPDGAVSDLDYTCTPFCGTWFAVNYEDPSWLPTARVLQGGRELERAPEVLQGLRVTRRVFVPVDGRFTRFVDVIENTTPSDVDLSRYGIYQSQYLAPTNGDWVLAATSSGDTAFDTADDYLIVTHAADPMPEMGLVLAGPGGQRPQDLNFSVGFGWADYRAEWGGLTLPPGGRVAFLHFTVHAPRGDLAGAVARSESLRNLTDPEALAGLTAAEKAAIVNFVVP